MKDMAVNLICTLVLAPILAFGIFAVSWWGTAPASYQQAPVMQPANQNSTAEPPGTTPSMSSSVRPVSGRLLFLANCASCHGADGSGQGSLVLDRPARSFKDGGFSFGNTIASIQRVITSGIPGTPMPGFKATLNPRERVAVAEYVQSLGPPVVKVDPDDTVMTVTDRPKVIRGELTPVEPGQPLHVRGLVAGGTDGLSWEYRTDDVRLLAVRQGAFVKRQNWNGRSGEPIKPLGRLIRTVRGGEAGPAFFIDGQPVVSRLTGTGIEDDVIVIRQQLASSDVHVMESGHATSVGSMSGYEREYTISNPRRDRLSINLNLEGPLEPLGTDRDGTSWYRSRGPSGLVEITGLKHAVLGVQGDFNVAEISGTTSTNAIITTLLVPEFTVDLRRELIEGAQST